MIKKILPTMIGAALTVGMTAAAADVTVFGHIDTAVVNNDQDSNFINTTGQVKVDSSLFPSWGTGSSIDDTNFQCTTCSIGFKGSEDLGNGLKAIFKLDFQYDTINRDTSSFTDRDQWLGLAGNFGSVKVGTISTPYKSHGAMIDPLYRTAAQGRFVGLQSFLHNGAGENGQGRADNTARYDSPSWNGLKVSAYYTLDSSETASPDAVTGQNDEDDDGYGVGVEYTNGGILVFADYVTNNSDAPGLRLDGTFDGNTYGDLSAWKVGGKYTFNNFAVMGQYESIEQDFGNSEEIDPWWHVAGTYTMGNNMIYAGYGQAEGDAGGSVGNPFVNKPDQTAFTIAGVHSMSKRTSIYAAYAVTEQDFDLTTLGSIAAGPGFEDEPERDMFAIGMKHKF